MEFTVIVRYFLLLVLLGLFGAQVFRDCLKFFRNESTLSFSSKTYPEIAFPNVIVCPQRAFDFDRMESHNIPKDFWIMEKVTREDFSTFMSQFGNNKTMLDKMWSESILSVSDFLKSAFYRRGETTMEDGITILQLPTVNYGSCHLVKFNVSFSRSRNMRSATVILNHRYEHEKFFVYLTHEPFLPPSVGLRFWYWQPKQIILSKESEHRIGLYPKERHKDETIERCREWRHPSEFTECILEVIEEKCALEAKAC